MANGELAPIWKMTRFCCTSGLCVECHKRGNHGEMKRRKRIVHADNLTKPMAEKMAANWGSYDPKVEAM
jgi:hypothetical protein